MQVLLERFMLEEAERGKIRVMDEIVEAIFLEKRIKFELRLEDLLPR